MSRRILLSFVFVAILLTSTTFTVYAAAPTLSGTFKTPWGQGNISYTAVRVIPRIGSQGYYIINSRRYPGSLYAIRGTSNLDMIWYDGFLGIPAGSAVVSPTGTANADSGTIQFVDWAGNVISSGTVPVNTR